MELKITSQFEIQYGGDHYAKRGIQPVQYIHANGLDFFQGNIVKYATRFRDKNGAEDLKKVIHYAQFLLELEYNTFSQIVYDERSTPAKSLVDTLAFPEKKTVSHRSY